MVEDLTSFERRVKRMRENYLRQVAERDGQKASKDTDSSELTAKNLIKMIENCSNIDLLEETLAEELEGKKRKTVIAAIEAKMNELEGEV